MSSSAYASHAPVTCENDHESFVCAHGHEHCARCNGLAEEIQVEGWGSDEPSASDTQVDDVNPIPMDNRDCCSGHVLEERLRHGGARCTKERGGEEGDICGQQRLDALNRAAGSTGIQGEKAPAS